MLLVYSAVQSQKAVSAYFTSKQILHFGFEEQYCIVLLTKKTDGVLHANIRLSKLH